MKLDADFFIGPTLHVAIAQDPNDQSAGNNVLAGAVMGIRGMSLMVAYDVNNERARGRRRDEDWNVLAWQRQFSGRGKIGPV